ncbi:hypothetical protein ACHQM5_025806 [Ranunculus cassubicifolius]
MASLVLFLEVLLGEQQQDQLQVKQDWDSSSSNEGKKDGRFSKENMALGKLHESMAMGRLYYPEEESHAWRIAECCVWP